MIKDSDTKDAQVILFSSILRRAFGVACIMLGYFYSEEKSSWALLLFGVVFIITGFIRPKRCLDDNCET